MEPGEAPPRNLIDTSAVYPVHCELRLCVDASRIEGDRLRGWAGARRVGWAATVLCGVVPRSGLTRARQSCVYKWCALWTA